MNFFKKLLGIDFESTDATPKQEWFAQKLVENGFKLVLQGEVLPKEVVDGNMQFDRHYEDKSLSVIYLRKTHIQIFPRIPHSTNYEVVKLSEIYGDDNFSNFMPKLNIVIEGKTSKK